MANYTKGEAREWARENLRGQWTTLITPFTPQDTVDEEALRHNIRHIRRLGVRGAGCTWGMGEFWSLTLDERMRVYDVVSDEARGGVPAQRVLSIAAHVTHTSARDMLALAKHAEAVGFDLLIVAAPYFVTKMEEQVIDFVRLLADNTRLAIMFYNSPQFGIVMSPAGLQRLCQIPNVVGVKEASFNRQISIETHLMIGTRAIISTPDEWIFFKGKELGFEQQVMFANTSDWRFDTPQANHYVRFVDMATQGNPDKRFYETHLRDIKQLSDQWWGRMVKKFGGALPVSLCKYWGELMGLQAGHVRPPLSDMTPEEKEELRQDLAALRPLSQKQTASAEQRDALHDRVYVTSLTPRPEQPSPTNGGRAAAGTASPAIQNPKSKIQNRAWLPNPANESGMMLMVSAQNLEEALEAEKGGADIVDIKNLQEAMVGSGHPMLAQEVRARIPAEKHVSVTLGVVPNQPGTVAMAVYAAAQLKATSVKVGFVKADYEMALDVLRESRRALEGSDTKLIGSLFADNHLYDGLDPHLIVQLAKEGQCDGLLIDTLTKDGRNLFDFMSEAELREVVIQGKLAGMSTALSGHLQIDDLDELARINPDIVGVRGAVCSTGDRNRAVAWEAVARFKRELDRRKSGEVDVHATAPANGDTTRTAQGGNGSGWAIVDGRGKNCAGVLAALSRQVEAAPNAFVEAIVADSLNVYDVLAWAEQGGHQLLTQRKDPDGTTRLLIQPSRARTPA
jgi:(5-formylfuran-3-yl)methyl phosphate synthase